MVSTAIELNIFKMFLIPDLALKLFTTWSGVLFCNSMKTKQLEFLSIFYVSPSKMSSP